MYGICNHSLVLFDSYYAADKLLNQIQGFCWTFTCLIKKNRIICAAPIGEDLTDEGESLVGPITGEVKGRVIRHDDKFFLTNDLSLTGEDILLLYSLRWPIEEVFKFLKSQLHLEACQARNKQAQENHLGSCILAYLPV